jgi:hypothetical protein
MISDVHAISANKSQLPLFNCGVRNFSGFYILLITAIVVIVLPTKVAPAPPLRLTEHRYLLQSYTFPANLQASHEKFSRKFSLAVGLLLFDCGTFEENFLENFSWLSHFTLFWFDNSSGIPTFATNISNS